MHNYGRIRQLDLSVGVSYGTDLDVVFRLIEEVLRTNARVLQDPVPVFGVRLLADFSVSISVNPWVNVPDYVAASAEINRAILEIFRDKGIHIPLPQQEVRMVGEAG